MIQNHLINEKAIFTLWLNWIVSFGAVVMPIFLALFLPRPWIPIFALTAILILIFYQNTRQRHKALTCDLLQTICIRTLCVSAIIMVAISLIYSKGVIYLLYPEEMLNTHIPYLSVLIIAPILALHCIYYMIRGERSGVCRRCAILYGPVAEKGFLGKIYMQENHYQIKCLMMISISLSVVCWIYYGCYYININLNGADHFFYNVLPTIVYVSSVVIFSIRYLAIWNYYYSQLELYPRLDVSKSVIRILIFHGNDIFICRGGGGDDLLIQNKYDTPASLSLHHRDTMNLKEAAKQLSNLSGLSSDEFSIRFMYKSTDVSMASNIFHFICTMPTKETALESSLQGEWLSLSQLQRLLYNESLTQLLATEINRLYTVAMAWKTYDISGRRLYKVKNYRPTFRLDGILDWNVDFNDSQWLEVARFNEDKPLFHIRKIFHRRLKTTEYNLNI